MSPTRDGIDHFIRDVGKVEVIVHSTRLHRTETSHGLLILRVAWIQRLLQDRLAIGNQLGIGRDTSIDGRDTDDLDGEGAVIRGEEDVEEGCREIGVILTWVQGFGFDHPLRGDMRGEGDESDERGEEGY